MKKIVLVLLVCVFMFSLAITASAKVKVVYWTYPSITVEGLQPGEYEQNMIDQFEKLYPEVEVELEIFPYDGGITKVDLSIMSGDPPDILVDNVFRVGKYADAGLLVPFELTEEEKADFYPFAIKASTFHGEMAVWPTYVNTAGILVSKKIAREAGALDLLPLDRPDRNWTAEEFKAFLQKVAAANLPEVRGLVWHLADANGQQNVIMMMIQGFGGVPFVYEDGKYKCTMNSPEAVEGLEFYIDIYNNSPGCFHEGAETLTCFDNGRLGSSGKMAVTQGGVASILQGLEGTSQIYTDDDRSIFPIPSKAGISNGALLSIETYGVFNNGDAEKAKYAQMFVRYFCENAPNFLTVRSNASPVRKSTQIAEAYQKHADNPDVQYYLTQLAGYGKDYGTMCPAYQQYKELWTITMQGVVTGMITAKEGLDEITRKVNKVLDELYEE